MFELENNDRDRRPQTSLHTVKRWMESGQELLEKGTVKRKPDSGVARHTQTLAVAGTCRMWVFETVDVVV